MTVNVSPGTPNAAQPESGGSTLSRTSRLYWLLMICVVVIGIDQLSKVYATLHWSELEVPHIFFKDLFRIQYARNYGAFLSLLGNASQEVRFIVLTLLNGLVLLGILVSLLWSKRMHKLTFFALALIVAGGLGNLIDRIRLGYVVDFLNLGIGDLRTGIFNIADMAISLSFCLMVYLMFKPDDANAKQPKTQVVNDVDTLGDELTKPTEHTTIIPDETLKQPHHS